VSGDSSSTSDRSAAIAEDLITGGDINQQEVAAAIIIAAWSWRLEGSGLLFVRFAIQPKVKRGEIEFLCVAIQIARNASQTPSALSPQTTRFFIAALVD
jgi:hypothetical protein